MVEQCGVDSDKVHYHEEDKQLLLFVDVIKNLFVEVLQVVV